MAYEGVIGKARKKFCEDYTRYKTAVFAKMASRQQEVAEENGKKISCSKGCWSCCTQYVGGSLQECDTIVHWLYTNEPVLKWFLEQYPKWREKVREKEDVFKNANTAAQACVENPEDAGLREDFLKASRKYHQLNVACPFLKEGACSIYPVRPMACGGLVAFSPPEACAAESPELPEVLMTPLRELEPSYFYGSDKMYINSPFALLVYELLKGGYDYLSEIPSMSDISDRVFADPDVRGVVSAIVK